MTKFAVVRTDRRQSGDAGADLSAQITGKLSGDAPDTVILFASPHYDHHSLLLTIQNTCHPRTIVGCSTAGEFKNTKDANSSAVAIAILCTESEIRFTAAMARGLQNNRHAAAMELARGMSGNSQPDFRFRAVLLLTDALAGYAEDFVENFTLATAGQYRLFGGGAGEDAKFSKTFVFCGTEVASDAAVALEILSKKRLGIGVSHGWRPVTDPMRVTDASDATVRSMNFVPAAEVFEELAQKLSEPFARGQPLPFFLHHVIGLKTEEGYKLRVPLSVGNGDSVDCAAEVPVNSTVCLMATSNGEAAAAAGAAVSSALDQLEGEEPGVALFFDCAATRLRMGSEFGMELAEVEKRLGGAEFAGCNTYGQIARAEGQFSGFHNCTAVVCVIPR
ncbi:MAG TPA: FIST N-terminal domain-containing protein [Bryobacteraceae bacterium]|nr:FIST N-terminal domain-containing protein [Bryobacteraceae bacterium]